MPASRAQEPYDIEARRAWMRVLARAGANEISTALHELGVKPTWTCVRGPESGLVMVRGRAGGSGAPFNLGEMSVTRCTIRLPDGTVGHAYVAGCDPERAELAAVVDALLLGPTHEVVQRKVIAPLAAAQSAVCQTIARKAAATRVDFFALSTMRTTT